MPRSNADIFQQLIKWGFRSGKTKYGRILMNGPNGGHILASRPDTNGIVDLSVVHNASQLIGVSVDRFWLGPLDEFQFDKNQNNTEAQSLDIEDSESCKPSSSKRFASSYQAEILRYLDSLPGSTMEDMRLGVVRSIWAALGKNSGQNLSSCGSSLSALENEGRIVSSYGHRSLDGKLCRINVSVLAEPPVGITTPPTLPVELSPLSLGSHLNDKPGEQKPPYQPAEREAELIAHISHLSEEIMLWSDMATELESNLIEQKQRQIDDASFLAALDEISSDIERKDTVIRWRDRQLRHREASISVLSKQLHEARRNYETTKSEYDALKSVNVITVQENEKLNKRIATLTTHNQRLQNELADIKIEISDTKSALERTQKRMFFSLAETLARGLDGFTDADNDITNHTLSALLASEDPLMSNGVTKHPYQSIISRSSHRGVTEYEWDIPCLPHQCVYDQPINKQKVKKELSGMVHGNWYRKLLTFCTMMEDLVGQGVVVVPSTEPGFCRITLPAEIRIVEKGNAIVSKDKRLDLSVSNDISIKTALPVDETRPSTEILLAPSEIGIMYLNGLNRTNVRHLPRNDLWIVANPDDEKQPMVRIPSGVLQKNVDPKRIDNMLSHGNRLFGLRELTSVRDQSRKLATVTVLLGMGGIEHIGSSKDDPREAVFNHGELTGLRGRILYCREQKEIQGNLKSQLYPIAHSDWHGRYCVSDSDGELFAEILIAVDNDR